MLYPLRSIHVAHTKCALEFILKRYTFIRSVENNPHLRYPQVRFSSHRANHKVSHVKQNRIYPGGKKVLGEKFGFFTASIAVAMFAISFAAVPLYRLYCQAVGQGQAVKDEDNKISKVEKDKSRVITVRFDAHTHKSMDWSFEPVQERILIHPGETALAFYRVKNPLDEPVIGVATYNVLPYEAGQYFTKIQCFCFEEQLLRPHEDVFMPVLFFIDPEYNKHPQLTNIDEVVLSYTFFKSKDGEILDLDDASDDEK